MDTSPQQNEYEHKRPLLWEPWMTERDYEVRMFFYGATAAQTLPEIRKDPYYDNDE